MLNYGESAEAYDGEPLSDDLSNSNLGSRDSRVLTRDGRDVYANAGPLIASKMCKEFALKVATTIPFDNSLNERMNEVHEGQSAHEYSGKQVNKPHEGHAAHEYPRKQVNTLREGYAAHEYSGKHITANEPNETHNAHESSGKQVNKPREGHAAREYSGKQVSKPREGPAAHEYSGEHIEANERNETHNAHEYSEKQVSKPHEGHAAHEYGSEHIKANEPNVSHNAHEYYGKQMNNPNEGQTAHECAAAGKQGKSNEPNKVQNAHEYSGEFENLNAPDEDQRDLVDYVDNGGQTSKSHAISADDYPLKDDSSVHTLDDTPDVLHATRSHRFEEDTRLGVPEQVSSHVENALDTSNIVSSESSSSGRALNDLYRDLGNVHDTSPALRSSSSISPTDREGPSGGDRRTRMPSSICSDDDTSNDTRARDTRQLANETVDMNTITSSATSPTSKEGDALGEFNSNLAQIAQSSPGGISTSFVRPPLALSAPSSSLGPVQHDSYSAARIGDNVDDRGVGEAFNSPDTDSDSDTDPASNRSYSRIPHNNGGRAGSRFSGPVQIRNRYFEEGTNYNRAPVTPTTVGDEPPSPADTAERDKQVSDSNVVTSAGTKYLEVNVPSHEKNVDRSANKRHMDKISSTNAHHETFRDADSAERASTRYVDSIGSLRNEPENARQPTTSSSNVAHHTSAHVPNKDRTSPNVILERNGYSRNANLHSSRDRDPFQGMNDNEGIHSITEGDRESSYSNKNTDPDTTAHAGDQNLPDAIVNAKLNASSSDVATPTTGGSSLTVIIVTATCGAVIVVGVVGIVLYLYLSKRRKRREHLERVLARVKRAVPEDLSVSKSVARDTCFERVKAAVPAPSLSEIVQETLQLQCTQSTPV